MSVASTPRNARGRRTREALLAATRQLVEQRGFADLTMAAVAERAGVTRRAIYLHFASRRELILALYDYLVEVEGRDASLRAVFDTADPVAALDEWAAHLARFHPRVMAVDGWVRVAARADTDVAEYRAMAAQRQRAGCGKLIDNLAAAGKLHPAWTPESAADMLWALISTDMCEALLRERDWDQAQLSQHLAQLLRSTFVDDQGLCSQTICSQSSSSLLISSNP